MLFACLLAFTACVFSLLLTPLVRAQAGRWGILDRPDGARKLHARPVPRAGGVVIALSYMLSLSVVGFFLPNQLLVVDLLPAAVVVFATGLADDLRGLKPIEKLAGQSVAALLAWSAGIRFAGAADETVTSAVLTLAWLLLATNAFNLIDGVDGLACGAGLLATVVMLASALRDDHLTLALTAAPLAGCLAGFLLYNFPPASIFLGDSGSLSIGFLIGCLGVLWSRAPQPPPALVAPFLALAVPLLDVGLTILRRYLRARPIFGADRGHIHHRLLDRGWTPRRVVLALYGAGLIAGVCAWRGGWSVAVLGVLLWLGVRQLGYREFRLAREIICSARLRHEIDVRLRLEDFSTALALTRSGTECWLLVRETARAFGFDEVTLHLGGESWRVGARSRWDISVRLSATAWVLFGRSAAGTEPVPVAFLVDALRRGLDAGKLAELSHHDLAANASA